MTERAAVCASMPDVHAALSAGMVSAGHADAIARAANRLDADERAELAAMAPTLFGRRRPDVGSYVQPQDVRPRQAPVT